MNTLGSRLEGAAEPDHRFHIAIFASQRFNLVGHSMTIVSIEAFESILDGVDMLRLEAEAGHGNAVDRTDFRRVAFDDHERRHVLGNSRQSPHKGAVADSCEMMDPRPAADIRIIPDSDMTGQHHLVCDGDAISKVTVVSDVRGNHDEVFVTNPCNAASIARSPVNGHMLADLIVIADFTYRVFAVIFSILRVGSDNGEWIEDIRLTDRGAAVNRDMIVKHGVIAYDPAEIINIDISQSSVWLSAGSAISVGLTVRNTGIFKFIDGSIILDGGQSGDECRFVENPDGSVTEVAVGAYGALVATAGVTLGRNTIEVGSHAELAVGVLASGAPGALLVDNDILVGTDRTPTPGILAIGAGLGPGHSSQHGT